LDPWYDGGGGGGGGGELPVQESLEKGTPVGAPAWTCLTYYCTSHERLRGAWAAAAQGGTPERQEREGCGRRRRRRRDPTSERSTTEWPDS